MNVVNRYVGKGDSQARFGTVPPIRSTFRRQGDPLNRHRPRKYSHDILNKNRSAFFGLGFILALAICHLIP